MATETKDPDPVLAELRELRAEQRQLRDQLTRIEKRLPQKAHDIDPEAIYSTGKAAKVTGLSRQTIYLKALAGEIERIPTGTKAIRMKGRALIAWLDANPRHQAGS